MANIPNIQVDTIIETPGASVELRNMSAEQRDIAIQMVRDAEQSAVYYALGDMAKAINSQGSLIGSISSDEFDVGYDAANQRITINPKNDGSEHDPTDENSESGLPDPQDYLEYTGVYVRKVVQNETTDEWEVLDSGGSAITSIDVISVAADDNTAGDRMAWVNDYMRFVEPTEE